MEQLQFQSLTCVVCKRAKRVDGRMGENAGKQAPAAIKNRDKQEPYRNRKDNLTQVIHKIHAAAVDQIDDMSDAERHAGNEDCRLDIVLCNGCKQKAPEDHLLQKSDAEHTHNAADRFRRRVIDRSAIPKVSRCQNHKRYITEEPPCRNG